MGLAFASLIHVRLILVRQLRGFQFLPMITTAKVLVLATIPTFFFNKLYSQDILLSSLGTGELDCYCRLGCPDDFCGGERIPLQCSREEHHCPNSDYPILAFLEGALENSNEISWLSSSVSVVHSGQIGAFKCNPVCFHENQIIVPRPEKKILRLQYLRNASRF
jgi:hypothetical protein